MRSRCIQCGEEFTAEELDRLLPPRRTKCAECNVDSVNQKLSEIVDWIDTTQVEQGEDLLKKALGEE